MPSLVREARRLESRLSDMSTTDVLQLHENTDLRKLKVLEVLSELSPRATLCHRTDLLLFVNETRVRWTLDYG